MRLKSLRALFALVCALALENACAAEVKLLGRELQGTSAAGAWKHSYDSGLGALSGPVQTSEAIYLGVGPAVLAYNERGEVLARYDLSAPVVSLDASGGVLRATVAGVGYREGFTLNPPQEGGTRERVAFAPNAAVTLWSEQYAASLQKSELEQTWSNNPHNAFVGLRLALELREEREAQRKIILQALASEQSFAVWTRLAVLLDEAGFSAEASSALHKARQDAAERGYHPLLRVSDEALAAYGDPAAHALQLQAKGQHEAATRWAEHLRQLHPRNASSRRVFEAHLRHLREGEHREDVARWEQFLQQLPEGTLYRWGTDAAARLEKHTNFAATSIAAALLLALLILGHPLRTSRAERLTVLCMAALLCWLQLGALWAAQQKEILGHPALNLGTQGGAWQTANLPPALPGSPEAALQRGVAAQLSGELSAARRAYNAAEILPCARNNLGTVAAQMGQRPFAEHWYQRAQNLPEAAHNLGHKVTTESLAFHKQHFHGAPAVCLPSDLQIMKAFGEPLSRLFFAQRFPERLGQLKSEWKAGDGPHLRLLMSECLALLVLLWLALPDRRRRATDRQKRRMLPMHNAWSGALLFCTVAGTRSWPLLVLALLGWAAALAHHWQKKKEEN